MNLRTLERPLLALTLLALAFSALRLTGLSRPALAEIPAASRAAAALATRFIDFDIGAATVRSGASHQDETTGIPDIPAYVLLPSTGSPLTMVNFTVPPDHDANGGFVARILWSAYSANSFPCFVVLSAELVGYGAGHSAALYDPFWAGAASTANEYILSIPSSSIQELLVDFRSLSGFPTFPGDITTFTLWRRSNDINDTCSDQFVIRSISFTYQGNVFADSFESGDTSRWG